VLVADTVQRRENVTGETGRLPEHLLDHVDRQILVQAPGQRPVEPGDVAHGEQHVRDRRAIGHQQLSRGRFAPRSLTRDGGST
jgi:hypothetical protein